MPQAAQLSCCGDGGCATGDKESSFHGPLQVTGYRLQRAVVEMTYPVLTVPPGACSRSTPVSVMGNNRARAGG